MFFSHQNSIRLHQPTNFFCFVVDRRQQQKCCTFCSTILFHPSGEKKYSCEYTLPLWYLRVDSLACLITSSGSQLMKKAMFSSGPELCLTASRNLVATCKAHSHRCIRTGTEEGRKESITWLAGCTYSSSLWTKNEQERMTCA